MLQNANALLTKREAADMLRVSLRTLERWRDAGVLVPVEFGTAARAVRYRRADVERLIGRRSA